MKVQSVPLATTEQKGRKEGRKTRTSFISVHRKHNRAVQSIHHRIEIILSRGGKSN